MHPFTLTKRLLLSGLAASIVGFSGTAVAQAPVAKETPVAQAVEVKLGKSGEVLVPLGATAKFTPKQANFKDVLSGNPEVLEAKQDPTDFNKVLLQGKAPGVTKLTFTFPDRPAQTYEVVVQPDYDLLRKVIQRAVPSANIEIIPGVGSSIILTGYVNKLSDADTIVRIAGGAVAGPAGGAGGGAAGGAAAGNNNVINAIQVGGVQHVQIEVVVAQVDRTELRSRGADFQVRGTQANFSSLVSGLINISGLGSGGGAGGVASGDANLQIGLVPSGIFAALRALRSEGVAKFISEPKVVTQSGRPAIITSGGQQAVLSAGGGLGGVSVALETVGTTLEVVPLVYGDGKIYLEVTPRVRTRNDGFGVQTTFGFSPGFTEQSTQASVMMESGQTFAIGGLLETSVQGTSNRVPVLGDLPYIGTAFSTLRFDERERELIILVTPRLVDAMDCSQLPKRVPGRETRSPDDYELFLEGLLEAPRGQRQVWNGRCYNPAWKCDANGQFPCKGNVCGGNGAGACATGTCPTAWTPQGNGHALRAVMPTMNMNTVTPANATVPVPALNEIVPAATETFREVPVPTEVPMVPILPPADPVPAGGSSGEK
ncbi:MAG: type II and III secretion system protein family protein [Gemmataceae bacterium]